MTDEGKSRCSTFMFASECHYVMETQCVFIEEKIGQKAPQALARVRYYVKLGTSSHKILQEKSDNESKSMCGTYRCKLICWNMTDCMICMGFKKIRIVLSFKVSLEHYLLQRVFSEMTFQKRVPALNM